MNFSADNYKKRYTTIDDTISNTQLSYEDKCDFIGFKPLSVRINELKMKGELNELMSALENNDIPLSDFFREYSDEKASEKPISVLNIKGLDRIELNNALIERARAYEAKVADYKASLDSYRGRDVSQTEMKQESEPLHAASGAELSGDK